MIDLERLKELDTKATKGPWCWNPKKNYDSYPGEFPSIPQGSHLGETLISLDDTYEQSKEDCALVEELRNALPSIIAELEASRKLIATLADYLNAKK